MPEFLIRLLIVVLVIWLVQVLLDAIELKPPAPKVIFVITLILGIIYLIGGQFLPAPIPLK